MKIKQARQLLYWVAYTIVVPVGFISILWIIAVIGESPNASFGEVFGTGDLLPLAAILLLSCSADIRMADDQDGLLMAVGEVLFLLMGILAVVVYGVFKMRGIELLRTPADKAKAALLVAIAKMSWAYVFAAIALTLPAKIRLLWSES